VNDKENLGDVSRLDYEPFKQRGASQDDEYYPIEMGKYYVLAISVADAKLNPVRNIPVKKPYLKFDEHPPSLGNWFTMYGYVVIEELVNATDNDGYYYLIIGVKNGGVGGYVINLDFGTAVSIPIPLKTESTLKSIQILNEPDFVNTPFDDPELGAFYVGRKFNFKARVRIDVTHGPKYDYVVIAQPYNISENDFSLGIIPHSRYELDEKKENTPGWSISYFGTPRVAFTDGNGEATFDNLQIADISGTNATMKFYFVAGDRHEGMFVRSNLTQSSYTFIPSLDFEIIQQPSKYISANSALISSPKIKVTSYIGRQFIPMSMQLKELFGREINDDYMSDITRKYFYDKNCFFSVGFGKKSSV